MGKRYATVGGNFGYYLRRLIHISMIVWPWLYYHYGPFLADYLHLSLKALAVVLGMLVFTGEFSRLALGVMFPGQRTHEAQQLSAVTWAALGLVFIAIVLRSDYVYPLVWTTALVDPLLGELRHRLNNKILVEFIGLVLAMFIWLFASHWFGFSAWWALVIAPITLAAEYPNIKYLDDNFLMLVVPAVVVLLLFQ